MSHSARSLIRISVLVVVVVGLGLALFPVVIGSGHTGTVVTLSPLGRVSPGSLDGDRIVIGSWLRAVPRSSVRLDGDHLEVRYVTEGTSGSAAAAYLAGLANPASVEMRAVMEVIGASRPAYATTALGPYEGSAPGEVVVFEDANGDGAFQTEVEPKLILGPVAVGSSDFASARAAYVQGTTTSGPREWEVDYAMTPDGGRMFADLTQRLARLPSPQNELAILVNGVDQGQPPQVISAITDGLGTITGRFDMAKATTLAAAISAATLPEPLKVTSQQAVEVRIRGSIWVPGLAMAGGALVLLLAVEVAGTTHRREDPPLV